MFICLILCLSNFEKIFLSRKLLFLCNDPETVTDIDTVNLKTKSKETNLFLGREVKLFEKKKKTLQVRGTIKVALTAAMYPELDEYFVDTISPYTKMYVGASSIMDFYQCRYSF